MIKKQLLDQRSDNKNISVAIVEHVLQLDEDFYVFLIEQQVNTIWDASMSPRRSRSRSVRTQLESEPINEWNFSTVEWRGGKTNNSFSQWNVIYNKHIALQDRVFFADIFFSLILKLFAHRTKIHKCFLFVLCLSFNAFVVAVSFVVAREKKFIIQLVLLELSHKSLSNDLTFQHLTILNGLNTSQRDYNDKY